MPAEVNCACTRCGNGLVLPMGGRPETRTCPRCGLDATLRDVESGQRDSCAACGASALFVQRDFNRLVGLGIIALAAVFAVKTWGISLLIAALIDLALYRLLPRITVCYACDAIHRGLPVHPEHQAFDHEVAEEFKEEKSKHRLAMQRWLQAHGPDASKSDAAPDAKPHRHTAP